MSGHVLALSGGVGGAKMAAGLAAILPPERLTVVVNTGDDFEHLGLSICPDIDSVVYAMAGLNDRQRGWGMMDESWQMMAMLRRLGGPDWFNLGDRDLAMHLMRSAGLRQGLSLSDVTAQLVKALGIGGNIVPMSDDPVQTQIETAQGWLDFQSYFVGQQCQPIAKAIRFDGAEKAQISPAFAAALVRPDLAAVVICPSNPYLSIEPILAIPTVREALLGLQVPRICISPLIGGAAVKGPLGKLLMELGNGANNAAIAAHYGALISHMMIDRTDVSDAAPLHMAGLCVSLADTLMRHAADQSRLAHEVLTAIGIAV
ncbi:MAG: hypothetical protein RLY97_1065 [Pseudomonadota bacterium]|jgi:LPPG:FO 2-phospho-L-lactate transferase